MIVSSNGAQETDARSPKKSCHAHGFVELRRKVDDVIKEGQEIMKEIKGRRILYIIYHIMSEWCHMSTHLAVFNKEEILTGSDLLGSGFILI